LNWIDAAIIATIIWSTYAAFNAGMIREVITIVGAIAAVVLAGLFYESLATDIEVAIGDPQTADIVSFGIILSAVIVASQLTALFLKQAASFLMLGIFDSIGGAAIGFLKGFIFVEIGLIVAITFTSLHLQDNIEGSAFAPLFLEVLPVLKHLLPGEFTIAIDNF
jgi:uncharacterized membrane protein required for colicin V production